MSKQKKSIIVLCIIGVLLIVSLVFSSFEERRNETLKDAATNIALHGIKSCGKVTVFVQNIDTGETVQFKARKRNDYQCLVALDYGKYIVEYARPQNTDYEIKVITQEFSVSEDAERVVEIEFAEEHVAATWAGFFRKMQLSCPA